MTSPALERLRIAIGMAVAFLVTVLAFALVPGASFIPSYEVALADAARWLAVPGLTLLVGLAFIANRRFFVDEAIAGGASDRTLLVAQRYVQNTVEQTVLAATAWFALAAMAPGRAVALLPVLAALFAAGRLAFWIGYLAAPWARAFGFALTFYPSAAILIWIGVRLFV